MGIDPGRRPNTVPSASTKTLNGTLVTPKAVLTLCARSSINTGSGQDSGVSQLEGGHPSRVEVPQMLMV